MPIASRSPDPATSREWILVVSITIVLILLLTWPLIPALTTSARLDSGDGRFSVWNVAWVDHALLTDPRHLFDANIFSPHTGTLAYSEPNLVAGVLGLPAYVLTHNAVAAHNFAVVVSFLARRVGTQCGAAVEIAKKPEPGAAPARYVPSTRRARDELGLEALIGLDEAIDRTLRWHS